MHRVYEESMPLVKVKAKRQLTLPKKIADDFRIFEGDMVEIELRKEQDEIVIRRTRVVADSPAPKLAAKEQRALGRARKKMEAIKTDMLTSKGLTEDEAAVAVKVDLIDPEQKWWWLENWQKGEREAERDIKAGRVETFDNPEEFLKSLT